MDNPKNGDEKIEEAQVESTSSPMKPYKPPVPYPQRLVKTIDENKYGTFLEMLKKLHISFPFWRLSLILLCQISKGFTLQQREVT